MKKICAIYTRKSSEEGLDQDFNSLQAQREACAAYITSQKSEGWSICPREYDDGGFSGGTLERPALQRLLEDIKARKVHIIVVYKIDRLTRSLMDFAKLVEVFDAHGVTFVSITQSFNTTTSMGRLTLNVLLSFAQFEREVTGERIRDKIAASKHKGMWMGGSPPAGYRIENRTLAIVPEDVPVVETIFNLYDRLGNVRRVKQELDRKGIKSTQRVSLTGIRHGGRSFTPGALYSILRNPVYIGQIRHKDKLHEGLHEGIIDPTLWQRVQDQLNNNATERSETTQQNYLLKGLIFDPDGVPYSPTYTRRKERRYPYYVSQNLLQLRDHPKHLISRLPAQEIEDLVAHTVRDHLKTIWPEKGYDPTRDHVLQHIDRPSIKEVIRSMVGRVTVDIDRISIDLKPGGPEKLIKDIFEIELATGTLQPTPVTIPYKTARAKHSVKIIGPNQPLKDILDLPPNQLKKLVQGIAWREDHFNGIPLKEIAEQNDCCEAYVSTAIFSSFDILESALPTPDPT